MWVINYVNHGYFFHLGNNATINDIIASITPKYGNEGMYIRMLIVLFN